MIITLVRHMETDMNQKKILQGMIDSKLSKKGIKQSHDFVETIDLSNVDAIYSSKLKRARYLGELISDKISKELLIDERLDEIDLGDWEGHTFEEVKIKFKDYYEKWENDNVNTKAPNGESYKDLEKRVMYFLEDLKNKEFKNVFVVTHSAVIKVIICSIQGVGLEKRANYKIYNGTMAAIETKDNKFLLKEITHI